MSDYSHWQKMQRRKLRFYKKVMYFFFLLIFRIYRRDCSRLSRHTRVTNTSRWTIDTETPPLQHERYRGWPLLKNIVAVYLFMSLLAQQQAQSHLLSSNINYELLATQTASKMEQYLSNLICEINKGKHRQDEPALQRYLHFFVAFDK